MSVNLKNLGSEEIKLQNYKAQIDSRFRTEIQDSEDRHMDNLVKQAERQESQIEGLKSDFEVRISKEAEQLEEALLARKASNEEKVQALKDEGESALQKTKKFYEDRLNEIKREGEQRVTKERAEFEANSKLLHEMAKKDARKKMEAPKT